MAEEDRRLIPNRPTETALSIAVFDRAISHSRQFAEHPKSRGLAVGEDIFTAIARYDAAAVQRIVTATPTAVFCLNREGNSPLIDGIIRYLSNDSYWDWRDGKKRPPVPRPVGGNQDDQLKWKKLLWRYFVTQQERLLSIAEIIRQVDASYDPSPQGSTCSFDIPIINPDADFVHYLSIRLHIAFGIHCSWEHPDFNSYFLERCYAYEKLGRWAEAISSFEEVFENTFTLYDPEEDEECRVHTSYAPWCQPAPLPYISGDDFVDFVMDYAGLLYFCPDPQLRNAEKSVALYRLAVNGNCGRVPKLSQIEIAADVLAWEHYRHEAAEWLEKAAHEAETCMRNSSREQSVKETAVSRVERLLFYPAMSRKYRATADAIRRGDPLRPPELLPQQSEWPWRFPDDLSRDDWIAQEQDSFRSLPLLIPSRNCYPAST